MPKAEMFKLPAYITNAAVHFNPGGRFHGWLFRQHPDGYWVSVAKLAPVPEPWHDPAITAPAVPGKSKEAK